MNENENNVDFRTIENVAGRLLQINSVLYYITNGMSKKASEDDADRIRDILYWIETELKDKSESLYRAIGV